MLEEGRRQKQINEANYAVKKNGEGGTRRRRKHTKNQSIHIEHDERLNLFDFFFFFFFFSVGVKSVWFGRLETLRADLPHGRIPGFNMTAPIHTLFCISLLYFTIFVFLERFTMRIILCCTV